MVLEDFKANMGSHFHLSWLRVTYQSLVKHTMYEETMRVYMLHIIGCAILDDKCPIYINVIYISLFVDFESLH